MRIAKVVFENGIDINIFELVKEMKIPAIFISGIHDLSTPTILVESFFNSLIAPKKELIVLKNSAHMPQLEEYRKFNEILINAKFKS